MATFDVCIVGAGPHALAVLSALHTPNAKLSEDKHMRRARGQGARGKRLCQTSVCVVDPSGEWLHQWNERFAALGIQYLRSPSWAHPDMFSSESLAEFAWREGRTDELRLLEIQFQTFVLDSLWTFEGSAVDATAAECGELVAELVGC